jgi:hypothetical protein
LSNGKVLIAGGYDNTSNSSSSAELYDPTSGTWSTTGNLNIGRSDYTATLLPNGKVLVVGGTDNELNVLNSAELYDPQTGTWNITASQPNGTYDHTATLLSNGKVLVTGGFSLRPFSISPDTFLYDSQTETWSNTPGLNINRYYHTATLLPNGKVLVAGGYDENLNILSSAELYDPNTVVTTISGFSPTSAAVGSIVTVIGSGFKDTLSVTINGISCSFVFISDSQLNFQVPLGATSGPIEVSTVFETRVSSTSLKILGTPPTVSSFSPTSGSTGTIVTINGTNFNGATAVKFRSTSASFTVLSDSQIQAVVPPGATTGAIVVTTLAGSNSSAKKFSVTP